MSESTESVVSLRTPNDNYPLVKIDNRGDVTLAVHETETSGVEMAFLVCSRTLARASDYFETLLYGRFAEAKGRASADTTPWVVHLYEDDAAAFEILLNVVHAKPKDVPSTVDESLLLTIIVMADKYLLTHHLRRVRSGWAPWRGSRFTWPFSPGMANTRTWQPDPRNIKDAIKLAYLTGHEEMMWCSLLCYAWHCETENGVLMCNSIQPWKESDAAGSDGDSQDTDESDGVSHDSSEGSEKHASGDNSIVPRRSSEEEEDESENDPLDYAWDCIPLKEELYFLPQVYLGK